MVKNMPNYMAFNVSADIGDYHTNRVTPSSFEVVFSFIGFM